MTELPQDFFLNGSKQIDNFKLLMNVCRMPTLSKTSCIKKWTTDFVADKLAILLVLHQQVVDEREERKQYSLVGHYAQPRKKMRQTFATLHAKYLECKQQYAEDQCINMNHREQMPLLNCQAKGAYLQDGILWDPTKQDLTKCPVCPHCCTMIMDNMQAIHAYNQGRQYAAMANCGNELFAAKLPKHGCFCYMVKCGGRPEGGNCPECIRLVMNGEKPSPSAGLGECGFLFGICLCRCQVVFEESHRVEISLAIKLLNKKQRKNGEGEAKKPKEKGLTLVFRALADALKNNLVQENQMHNGWSEVELCRLQRPSLLWI